MRVTDWPSAERRSSPQECVRSSVPGRSSSMVSLLQCSEFSVRSVHLHTPPLKPKDGLNGAPSTLTFSGRWLVLCGLFFSARLSGNLSLLRFRILLRLRRIARWRGLLYFPFRKIFSGGRCHRLARHAGLRVAARALAVAIPLAAARLVGRYIRRRGEFPAALHFALAM